MSNMQIAAATFKKNILLSEAVIPTYARVEPLPYDPSMTQSLAAPLADPLWMLGRQWQLQEFAGEDGGSPLQVKVGTQSGMLTKLLPGKPTPGSNPPKGVIDYQHQDLPLEAHVEREAAFAQHARLSLEAGLYFLRLLQSDASTAGLAGAFRAAYPLDIKRPAQPQVDLPGAQWHTVLTNRGINGHAIAAALRPLMQAGALIALPAAPAVPAAQAERCKALLAQWLTWFDTTFIQPTADPDEVSAWNPHRLEYALTAQAQLPDAPVLLHADEYTGQAIDWYTFDVSDRLDRAFPGTAPNLGLVPPQIDPPQPKPTLPVPVKFPGMPARRFWELEDEGVSLPQINAGPGDLARLLMVEFALVYGSNWFIVPLDLPVGSVTRFTQFTVTDTFGVTLQLSPAREQPSAGGRWEMFSLNTVPGAPQSLGNLLFIAPTAPLGITGEPLEEIALFRDEMANMVWGVEHLVQGTSGDPYPRRDSAGPWARTQLDPMPEDVTLVYRLMTPVPENWIPFVPVAVNSVDPAHSAIQLEQRALIRPGEQPPAPPTVDAEPPFLPPHPPAQPRAADPGGTRIFPLGKLLRDQTSRNEPLRLEEEEVPREGVLVRRNFEFCRWNKGRRVLWLARNKETGKGEGSSGLRFDAADAR